MRQAKYWFLSVGNLSVVFWELGKGLWLQRPGSYKEGPGFESRHKKEVFPSLKFSIRARRHAQPQCRWYLVSFLQLKRAVHDIDSSRPSNVEVRKVWVTSSTVLVFLVLTGVKLQRLLLHSKWM
jgi:hypothetical protein